MIVYLKYVEVESICQPIRSPEISEKSKWISLEWTLAMNGVQNPKLWSESLASVRGLRIRKSCQTHIKDNICCRLHIG